MGVPKWAQAAKAAAGAALPTIGTVLGGPLGGILGATIARQLGTEPTPDAVAAAIATDPDAYVKLKEIEAELAADENATLVQLSSIEVQDRQDARSNRGDDRMRMVLTLVLVPAPLLILALMATGSLTLSAVDQVTVSTILGYLLAEARSATSFYFGTSVGSSRRAKEIAEMKR